MINEQGGINGRKINFLSVLTTAYSPPKTVEQVRRLVEARESGVYVPDARHRRRTSRSASTCNDRQGVPQLFVSTGAADVL